MAQRGASVADIKHGLSVAGSCKLQGNGRWKVPAEDLDGDDLTLIVALDNGVVIVTLFQEAPMKRCTQCRGSLRQEKIEETIQVGGHRFVASLPARVCASCRETYLDAKTLGRFELRVAISLAQAGETKGEVFQFIRKAIRLRAADLGDLLGVAPETISRRETGERAVDRAAFALVADMAQEALEGRVRTLEMLKSMKAPKRLAKTVRLVA